MQSFEVHYLQHTGTKSIVRHVVVFADHLADSLFCCLDPQQLMQSRTFVDHLQHECAGRLTQLLGDEEDLCQD